MISPGDVVRCIAQQQDVNGSVIQNVFFYKHMGSNSVTEADFLTEIEVELSAMYTTIQAYIPNTSTPTSIICDKVGFSSGRIVSLGAVGEIAWTTWGGGAGASEGLPQGCSALVAFPTSSVGVVGRKFFGVLCETAQSEGTLVGAFQTALIALGVAYLNGFQVSAQTFSARIMSTKFSSEIAIVSTIVKAVVGYQRRRKSGVGS